MYLFASGSPVASNNAIGHHDMVLHRLIRTIERSVRRDVRFDSGFAGQAIVVVEIGTVGDRISVFARHCEYLRGSTNRKIVGEIGYWGQGLREDTFPVRHAGCVERVPVSRSYSMGWLPDRQLEVLDGFTGDRVGAVNQERTLIDFADERDIADDHERTVLQLMVFARIRHHEVRAERVERCRDVIVDEIVVSVIAGRRVPIPDSLAPVVAFGVMCIEMFVELVEGRTVDRTVCRDSILDLAINFFEMHAIRRKVDTAYVARIYIDYGALSGSRDAGRVYAYRRTQEIVELLVCIAYPPAFRVVELEAQKLRDRALCLAFLKRP